MNLDIARTANDVLLEPIALNKHLHLKNRIVLAPCTRNRSEVDLSPTKGAIEHYASRADAGLLITEGTIISKEAQGGPGTPGIFNDAQVRRWAEVVTAVHDRDGVIFSQLWHLGRMAHSFYSGGAALAPSAVHDAVKHRGDRYYDFEHEAPEAMTEADIARTIADYASAARNAKSAGFDGIEIHAANGYLPEQFLRQHTNRRDDAWGGPAENRARFLLEVIDACASAIGYERVGVRVSPAAHFAEMVFTPGDEDALLAVLEGLRTRPVAYVHTGVDDDVPYDYLGGRSTDFLRRHYEGPLIGCGGYTPETSSEAVKAGRFDLAAFGRLFLANADLVSRVRNGAPLNSYTRQTYEDLR